MAQEAEVNIECGSGAGAYMVTLTGADIGVFNAAAQKIDMSKTGEELIAALLTAAGGGISKIERWNKEGFLSDGPNGEPGHQEFYPDGTRMYEDRYRDGKSNDGPNGEAAQQQFYPDGRLRSACHLRNDKYTDGANGEPACREFDEVGKLVSAESYRDGERVKELTEQEIADYLAQIEKAAKPRVAATTVSAVKNKL